MTPRETGKGFVHTTGGGLGGVASAKSWSDQAKANNSAKHNVDSAKAELATAQQNVAKANKSGDEKQIKDAADAYSKALDKVADAEKLHTDAGGYDVSDEGAKKAKEEADKAYQSSLDAMGGNKEQLDKLITDEQKRQEQYKEWAKEREEKAEARDERHEAKKSASQALASARDTRDKNTATRNAISQVTSRGTEESRRATSEARAAYKDAKKAEKEAKQAAKDAQRAATYGNKEQQKNAQAKADYKAKLADKKADYAKAKAEEAKVKADKYSTKAQKERAEAKSARANATVKRTEADQKRSEATAAKDKAKDAKDGTAKKAQLEKEAKEKDEAAKEAEADAEAAEAEAKMQEGEANAAEAKENAPPPPPPPPCDCKPPCPPGTYCICLPPPPPPGGDPGGGGDGGGKGAGAGDIVIPEGTMNLPPGKQAGGDAQANELKQPGDGGDRYGELGAAGDGGGGASEGDAGGAGQEHGRRDYGPDMAPQQPPDGPRTYVTRRRKPSRSEGPGDGGDRGGHVYAQAVPLPPPPPPPQQQESPAAPSQRLKNVQMDKDLCDKLKALLDLIKAILEDLKKDAAAAKKTEPLLDDPWFFWMLLSFAWHESAMLTSRTQIGGGPGSGLTQYESARAIEVVDHILSTPEPWTKNLAEAASAAGKSPVTREDMKSALEAYSAEMNKREKKDKYRWPGATGNTDPKHTKLPDTKSERLRYWLLNSDAFSIKFSAIDQLRSHSGIPTKTEMDKGGVKLGSAAAGEVLSKYWADNWNRNDDLKAREAARKEFLVHYEELLKALKKCGLQGSVPGLK